MYFHRNPRIDYLLGQIRPHKNSQGTYKHTPTLTHTKTPNFRGVDTANCVRGDRDYHALPSSWKVILYPSTTQI